MSALTKTFIAGIVLGAAGAAALVYSIEPVDLYREPSHVTVQANGGNVETFRMDLPRDRIMVGLAGEQNTLPAELDWPGDALFGNMQAELFKVRDRNDVVVGVASRIASASERTGPFIEWVLHLPARGTLYLQMAVTPAPEGHRNGRVLAGTLDFETLRGTARERFITDVGDGDSGIEGRIELVTVLVAPLVDDEPEESSGENEA